MQKQPQHKNHIFKSGNITNLCEEGVVSLLLLASADNLDQIYPKHATHDTIPVDSAIL